MPEKIDSISIVYSQQRPALQSVTCNVLCADELWKEVGEQVKSSVPNSSSSRQRGEPAASLSPQSDCSTGFFAIALPQQTPVVRKNFIFDWDEYVLEVDGVNSANFAAILSIRTNKKREYLVYDSVAAQQLRKGCQRVFQMRAPEGFHFSSLSVEVVEHSRSVLKSSLEPLRSSTCARVLSRIPIISLFRLIEGYLNISDTVNLLRINRPFYELRNEDAYLSALYRKSAATANEVLRHHIEGQIHTVPRDVYLVPAFLQSIQDSSEASDSLLREIHHNAQLSARTLESVITQTRNRICLQNSIEMLQKFGQWALSDTPTKSILKKKLIATGNCTQPACLVFELNSQDDIGDAEWRRFQDGELALVCGVYAQRTATTESISLTLQLYSEQLEKTMSQHELADREYRVLSLQLHNGSTTTRKGSQENGSSEHGGSPLRMMTLKNRDKLPKVVRIIINVAATNNQNTMLPMAHLVNPFIRLVPVDLDRELHVQQ